MRSIALPLPRRFHYRAAVCRQLLTVLGLLSLASPAWAQLRSPTTTAQAEPLLELRTEEGHLSLRLGMYLSTLLEVQPDPPVDGRNGFSITNARVAFFGDLVEHFDYMLQLELVRADSPLLDLALGYRPIPEVQLDIGLFKVPFSAEFLLAAANTDFINRAPIVVALVPGRQVGAQLSGQLRGGQLFYAAGVFNGTTALANDDNDMLFAARLGSNLELGDGQLTFAANAAGGAEDAATVALLPEPFSGTRLLVGGDARFSLTPAFVAAEVLWGRFDPDVGATEDVLGWYVTGGYAIHPLVVALLRWDHYDPGALGDDGDKLIVSAASGAPGAAPMNVQLDYVIPLQEPSEQRVLLNIYAVY